MSEYRAIRIEKGNGGFGGPLVVKPTNGKDKLVYICSSGAPDIVAHIAKLSGCKVVDGFKTTVPDQEIFLVIIDCGGNLRCGIYPKKRIPTININPIGKSGPLAEYITEDIYVSASKISNITLVEEDVPEEVSNEAQSSQVKEESKSVELEKLTQKKGFLQTFAMGCGKVIATFNSSAKKSVNTVLTSILPFMGFVALLSGIINGSGFGNWFAMLLKPLAGNMIGLCALGFICSIPLLSCLLGPGAVIAQIIGVLIGNEIAKGNIPAQLALPALFAINTQCGCDFIPVGLGLMEADPEVVEVGVPSILYSRLLTSIPRVLIAGIASIGMFT